MDEGIKFMLKRAKEEYEQELEATVNAIEENEANIKALNEHRNKIESNIKELEKIL